MALDKAIQYKKERRKIYYRSKASSVSCRNHGACDFCKGNRLYSSRKRSEHVKALMKAYEQDNDVCEYNN